MSRNEGKVILNSNDMELRFRKDGNIDIVGKIKYGSESGVLFDRVKKDFFIEIIEPNCFSNCLKKQLKAPALLFNHSNDDNIEVVNFSYEELYASREFKFTYVVVPNDKLINNLDKITNFSFGFYVEESDWKRVDRREAKYLRTIKSFNEILEFSLLIGLESAYESAKVYFDNKVLDKEEVEEFIADIKAFILSHRRIEIEEIKEFLKSRK